jgi:hypothetical protein
MSTSDDLVRVVSTDDGILLFGQPQDLDAFDEAAPGRTRRLNSSNMARVGKMLSGIAQFQAQSGRWMELSEESVDFMRSHGISVSDVTSAVLRKKDSPITSGNGGEILKHLKFENAALLTPAAPQAMAAMAAQEAIQLALDEITDYLAVIDAKIDTLLKQPKIEMRGELGGLQLALEEAEQIFEATGTISSVTFAKVQNNTFELQKAQAHCLAQLDEITADIRKHAGDTDKLSTIMRRASDEMPFWLRALAQAISFHDRQYVLELARMAEAEPDQLDAHRVGIRQARAARTQKIAQSLSGMLASIQDSGALNNLARVIHFGDAKRIHQAAEEVRQAIDTFAAHAELEGVAVTAAELTPWAVAAKGLLDEAATGVRQAGTQVKDVGVQVGGQVAGQVGQLNEKVQQRRLSGLQRRAEKLKGKLGKPGSKDATGTDD